ncbi:hypothetical protein TrLO_g12570 [Triparma laevis f. longispina]|uniref:Uncharacterized protein n=1 Tax=Triparma laevis f. longispina TaxID=1714387 RepID=A0A9W6ZPT1_9STRA|nr:hypothetical protein TrLO_g12570 [Triparma laevis f. longispina]
MSRNTVDPSLLKKPQKYFEAIAADIVNIKEQLATSEKRSDKTDKENAELQASFGAIGYFTDDERWAWASVLFWSFSFMSLRGAALGNPRQCGDWKEKVFVGICALLPGLSCFVNGLTTLSASAKYGTEHRLTFILGWFWIIIGSIFTLLGAPAALGVNYSYSKLNDGDLSEAIKTIFQSIPQVAFPCLFVASSSIRCIMNSTPVTPVIVQRGNPTVPSLMATIFMGLIFFIGYVIPPLLTYQHNLTWGDIMAMRFRKREKYKLIYWAHSP